MTHLDTVNRATLIITTRGATRTLRPVFTGRTLTAMLKAGRNEGALRIYLHLTALLAARVLTLPARAVVANRQSQQGSSQSGAIQGRNFLSDQLVVDVQASLLGAFIGAL